MTINTIYGPSVPLTSSDLFANLEQSNPAGATALGTSNTKNATQTNPLMSAIVQALSQVGIQLPGTATAATAASVSATSQTATSGASSSAQTPAQALQSFLNTLYASLTSSANAGSAASAAGVTGASAGDASSGQGGATDGTSSSGVGAGRGHRHHGHGHMGAELQNLIQQLAASSSGTSATGSASAMGSTAATAANGTTGTGSSGNSLLASLQTSFANLVQVAGGTGASQATLGGFLNTLARDLPARATGGALVSTQA